MKIRQAEPGDCAALYDLYSLIGKKAPGYFEQCLAEQEAGRRVILLADGAGYVMYNRQPQYALYKKLGIPEIQDLNVVPAARRQGVATALIKACEDRARHEDATHIGISAGLYADYGPAQRLYVKLGYMPDGYGVTYDRAAVSYGEIRPVDDNLCLMMIKAL